MTRAEITVRELRQDCEKIRRHILHLKLAEEEELERHWPPEPEWPVEGTAPAAYLEAEPEGEHAETAQRLIEEETSLRLWVRRYGHMCRFWGRAEWMKSGSDYASEQLLQALRDEPKEVCLTSGQKWTVYPKSFDVLRWCAARQETINFVRARQWVLERSLEADEVDHEAVPEPLSVLRAAEQEVSDQDALLVWVATSPGASFPWKLNGGDPWVPSEPTPAEFRQLHPLDVHLIARAFQAVNYLRLHWLPHPKQGKSTTWDAWFANRSKRMGQPARHLMMHESFASQLAADALQAHTLEEILGGD